MEELDTFGRTQRGHAEQRESMDERDVMVLKVAEVRSDKRMCGREEAVSVSR